MECGDKFKRILALIAAAVSVGRTDIQPPPDVSHEIHKEDTPALSVRMGDFAQTVPDVSHEIHKEDTAYINIY